MLESCGASLLAVTTLVKPLYLNVRGGSAVLAAFSVRTSLTWHLSGICTYRRFVPSGLLRNVRAAEMTVASYREPGGIRLFREWAVPRGQNSPRVLGRREM